MPQKQNAVASAFGPRVALPRTTGFVGGVFAAQLGISAERHRESTSRRDNVAERFNFFTTNRLLPRPR